MHRISLVSNEQAKSPAKEIFADIQKKTGSVINFFRGLGHKPEVVKALIPLYTAITGPGAVDPKIKEFVYVKTSMVNGCEYWLSHHLASSKRAGITQDQLRALAGDYQHSNAFSAAEKAAIRHAEQVTRDAKAVSDSDFQELKKHFNEEQIVEITLVSCMANFTNRFNDALHIPLDAGMSAKVG